ncbi:mucin-binding protein [Limosilactobacillus reuteri]|uniref:mucin-binding protein n=1 Tax=Limosilactobacillus reuteri TaxID=1598 RepID=UPI003D77BBA9
MLSKNNSRELQRKMDDKQDRFTLRKLSIGVASVLLGSFLMGIQISQTAYASDETVSQAPNVLREDTKANSQVSGTSSPGVVTDKAPSVTTPGEEKPVSQTDTDQTTRDQAQSVANKDNANKTQSIPDSGDFHSSNVTEYHQGMFAGKKIDFIVDDDADGQKLVDVNTNGETLNSWLFSDANHMTPSGSITTSYMPLMKRITDDRRIQKGQLPVAENSTYERDIDFNLTKVHRQFQADLFKEQIQRVSFQKLYHQITVGNNKRRIISKTNPGNWVVNKDDTLRGVHLDENGNAWFNEVEIPQIEGYKFQIITSATDLPNQSTSSKIKTVKIDPNNFHANISVMIEYSSLPQHTVINFVDDDKHEERVPNDRPYDLFKFTDATTSVNPANLEIPAGYELAKGQSKPISYTFKAKDNPPIIIRLVHKIMEITPDTPPEDIPADLDVDPNDLIKKANLTVNYENNDGTAFTGQIPENHTQTLTFKGKAYYDLVTGKLVNAKYVQDAKITVRYLDGNNNFKVLDQKVVEGEIGDQIDYDVNAKIQEYEEMGYALDSNGYTAGNTFTKDNNGKTYNIIFRHASTPVTPDNPNFPSSLFTSLVAVPSSTSETEIPGHWVLDTDNQDKPKIHWDYDTQSFTKVISPNEDHYYVKEITSDDNKDHRNGNDVNVININRNDIISPDNTKSITLTVTYAPKRKINVNFIDDTTKQELRNYNKNFDEAKPGDSLNGYSTSDSIQKLEAKNYVLVKDGFTDAKLNNQMPDEDNTYEVHLIHGATPKTETKKVNLNVTYQAEDGSDFNGDAPKEAHQTVEFTGTYYIDAVTGKEAKVNAKQLNGKWVVDSDDKSVPTTKWNDETKSFEKVVSPQKDHYYVTDITSDDQMNHRNGNDVDEIDGLTHDSNDINVVVKYALKHKINVHYIDDNPTDHQDLSSYDWNLEAKPGDALNYTTATTLKTLEAKGYKIETGVGKGDQFTAANLNGKMPNADGVYNVYLVHDTVPVNPDTPNKHGVDPNELTKNVKETVHYVGAGDKTPADSIQNSKWTRTVTVDAVTNEIIPNGQYTTDWTIPNGQKTTYDQVNTSVVEGYYADQANVPATAVTQDDIEKTVTYKPVGNVVPVDPNGNPIPGVPSTPFPNDPTDPTKTTPGTKPTVPGYHPETGKPGDPVDPVPGNPGEDVKVPYVKDQGAVQVIYHDDTTNTTIPNVGYNSGDLDAGTKVDYTTASTIADLEKQGYVYVSTDGTIPDEIPNSTVTVTVHMKHGVKPVNPNNPDDNVDQSQFEKDVKEIVHYIVSDDKVTAPADNVQTSKWTRTLTIDTVTHKLVSNGQYDTDWAIPDGETKNYDAVVSPDDVPGYHPDQNSIAATPVTQDDLYKTVVYSPNGTKIQNRQTLHTSATVHYEGAGNKTPADNVQNVFDFVYSGDTYDAETGDKLSDGTWNATSHVYNAVTVPTINGYHTEISVVPSSDLTVTQDKPEVTVTVKYVKNGEEVVNKQNLPASQTVKYVDEQGNELHPEKKQTAEFIYSGDTKDSVTGQITKQGSWNVTNHNFTAEDVPVINGYVAISGYTNEGGQYVAGGFNASNTGSDADRNKVFTVVYKKVGKIIPVDPSRKPIPDVPQPQYPTDPTDPTKVTPNEPVPDVPGYRPTVPTVTPDKPTEDTPVVYNQVQKADLTIVDQDNNNQQIIVDGVTTKFNADGIKDENIVFTGTEAAQAALEARGYEFVSSNFTNGTKFDDDANTDQHFVIVMKHGQQPVTPTNPGKPGEPINPNDPDGPKYPAGSDQVTKNVTRTIQYVDENGNKVREPVEQTAHFTGEGVLDKVTGQWITPLTWSGSQSVASVKSPVVGGYRLVNVDRDAAGNDVAGVTLTHNDNSYTVTVKYAKNGKIIPVDPSRKPIPDVPQPQYPTDPTDPTKVTPDEPVPEIPGYTPETPTVTPDKPGEDTPVVYHQNVQAKVNYIDDVTGQTLKTDTLQGVEGNKSDYSTKGSIANYESQGYKLVSDDFPADGYTFATGEHIFNVHLTHSTSPVNPDHPGAGYSATDLKKTVTRTINYLDGQGNTVHNSVSQSFDFIANGTVDNVTHKLVTVENGKITGDGQLTWNAASHDFDAVVSPAITGMHITNVTPTDQKDGDNVAKTTVNNQSGNIIVNVYYAPNGAHQDGAKTIPSTQTVTFVDEDGNELHDPAVSDFTFSRTPDVTDAEGKTTEGSWNTTSHTYGTVNVPVIPGYIAEVTTAGGKTATIDNPNVTDKVVYKKVGKIIPVDPTGKPIPDTPTPSYPNDPTDSTKVTPDEPVPSIPGYTPDTPTVTPDKPTTDTPVVYRQNVQATVTYIDDVTGSTLKTDILTGLDGKPSDYSTKGSIANYESQGYKLVSDDFPADGYTFSTTGTHNFTVHLTHGTEPVNPEHPGAGYDKTDLQKEVTRTIHFVNTQDGKQVADPASETVNFTANGTVDKVTGKLVTVENGKITGPGQLTWTPAQDVKAVQSPAINGMHVTYVSRDADGTNVKGVSLTHNDSSYDVYVSYAPNGTTNEHGRNTPASQTIKFVDENGNTLRENNVQISEFTRTPDVVDSVTGKTITEGSWNETSHKFGTINVPVIDGYVAEVTTAGGLTATTDNPNVVTEVVYKKVGKIIPVDPTGKSIPNAPMPNYPNDPTDPTKVTPDEPVPSIPGYTPEVPTVTPDKPTEDTPVVYHPVDNTQNAQVRYIDLTNNEELANSGNLSGQPGDKINYSTADEIKSLEDKGYVLVNDGFPTDAAFDNDKDHDQVFTVTFRHDTQPVTPTNPGKPGEPINPSDPDGPKYPAGSDQVTKDVTRTIQYVDENGNKVRKPVEQTAHFTGEGVLDKVTGQWITPITWTGNGNLTGEKTPVVEGYHVVRVSRDSTDNINVDGTTVNHETNDYTVTVSYAKNGKIVPVDKNGKLIPDTPTPQYPTDPINPTEVTSNEPVPHIPGYTPEVPTITPRTPSENTYVVYIPKISDKTENPITPTILIQQEQQRTLLSSNMKVSEKANILPQTGNDQNSSSILGFAFAAMASILGLTGLKKKREK